MIKENLSYAYRILSFLGLDDHTYTHLSARTEEGNSYYIYPFGLRFSEASPHNLLTVDLTGQVSAGDPSLFNPTAHTIHGNVYAHRPDLQAIFHLHTPATVAVSALEEGLLPISQWALHLYNRIAYHPYDSLELNSRDQAAHFVADLGTHSIMLMRSHGFIAAGRTVPEALFYTYHLEQASKAQCLALGMGRPLVLPSQAVCERANHELLNFEQDLGMRDWQAWLRHIGPL